jgi:hypothetical protein
VCGARAPRSGSPHEVVDDKTVRTYHRPDEYAIDAFFS